MLNYEKELADMLEQRDWRLLEKFIRAKQDTVFGRPFYKKFISQCERVKKLTYVRMVISSYAKGKVSKRTLNYALGLQNEVKKI